MKKILKLCIVIMLLSSCHSNEFHFVTKGESVISCNSKGIDYLSINNESASENFTISWEDSLHRSPTEISLVDIPKGYTVYDDVFNANQILLSNFKLSPNSKYSIIRTQGDAGSYEISIWTDRLGKVIRTSKKDCQ